MAPVEEKVHARRDFLKSFAPANDETAYPSESMTRSPAPPAGLASHVADRLGYGPQPGQIATMETQGVQAWIQEQLNPTSSDTQQLADLLNILPHETLNETVAQLWDRRSQAYSVYSLPQKEIRHATTARNLLSKWQLKERMVEFWHNHFNIYSYDGTIITYFPIWDNTVRANALGNFKDLLIASAQDVCMLTYLDNYISTNSGPNENYARELIELHTLGAMNYNKTGGYIDNDVYEASRCFTGWTYERSNSSPDRGKFKYVAANHDRFQKIFLNHSIPNDQAPMQDGLQVLGWLAEHPGTAKHIAYKLVQKFVSDNPPNSLVNSTATVFLNNANSPTQIRDVLAHIFASSEFTGTTYRGKKFKRPYDWVISAMRGVNLPYRYLSGTTNFDMIGMIDNVGQQIFGWRSPDGPSDVAVEWASPNNLLRRCNFILQIAAEWYVSNGRNLIIPHQNLMPTNLTTARQIGNWWIDRVFQRPVSDITRQGIIDFIAKGRNADVALTQEIINKKLQQIPALCVISPEFNWR